jgi:SGNH domain-containing protein
LANPLLSRIIAENELAAPVTVTAVFVSVGLAWTTYVFAERPIRRCGNQTKIATVLFAITLAIGTLGFAIYANKGFEGRSSIAQLEKARAVFVGRRWQYAKNENCLQRFPIEGTEQYLWWFCMESASAPPTVLLLGNSYANQLYPGLVQALPHQTVLSIGTCGPEARDVSTWVSDQPPNWPCYGRRPYEQQVAIDRFIAQSRSLRFAVLAGLKLTDSNQYVEALIRRIDFLEANRIKVVVFVPHIELPFDIRHCFPRPLRPAPRTATFRCHYARRSTLVSGR